MLSYSSLTPSAKGCIFSIIHIVVGELNGAGLAQFRTVDNHAYIMDGVHVLSPLSVYHYGVGEGVGGSRKSFFFGRSS